jgi:succinate-semialdehyde dehydrogenase/glutarate-semialdehyde dehydrogenase
MASALPAAGAARTRSSTPRPARPSANCRWPSRPISTALETARKGFRIWRDSTPQQRAAVLQGAARLMLERQDDLARIATLEEGKTLPEARIEVMMNVGLFNFYAGEVFRLYGRTLVRPAGMRSTVTHEPVGPVAAFAPWNFPLGNPGASWARRSRRAAR